jgi:hypothetical protein
MPAKRTKAEWTELIAKQKASGQTVKVWCSANGVSYHTFVDRASRIRKESKPSAPAWVEIQQEAPRLPAAAKDNIQVKTGIFIISVPEDFSEVGFARVCRVLMNLC